MRLIKLAALLAAFLPAVLFAPARADEDMYTKWIVKPSEGLDAILMVGIASGDVLQQEYYAETAAFLRERMPEVSVVALDRIDQVLRVENRRLTGPTLANVFSAGSIDTLQDVLRSARDPDTYLRPVMEAEESWDEERYLQAKALMPDVVLALEGLEAVGFEAWYAEDVLPILNEAVAENLAAVAPYDIIREHERYLGRSLEPEIELLIVRFSRPYGIRIRGQRFIAYHGWSGETQLRVAAHEIFHPPFDMRSDLLGQAEEMLGGDEWISSIIENHDPAFGYNTFRGLIDEDSSQALDQIVSDRLGFARDPAERWRSADDGMHMLAAALYHAMKEDGFAETGGVYGEWLASALERGLLTPEEVRRRAALVVDEAAVQKWYDLIEGSAEDNAR